MTKEDVGIRGNIGQARAFALAQLKKIISLPTGRD
jgi:hypothetical protein